jgi:hypothetical protein
MNFRLVDDGWAATLEDAIRADRSSVRLVCPFIKKRAVERLLEVGKPGTLQVITRYDLRDFADGVSDLAALRLLLEHGALIRGVRNLHAKLYLFGESRAIVTSANLTEAALLRNHEFGFVAEDAGIVGRCRRYFDNLWGRAGQNLSAERLKDWESKVAHYLAGGARAATASELSDEGVNAGVPSEPVGLAASAIDAGQWFVKFFGTNDNRTDRSLSVLEEVERSGCHWACAYPRDKRPRQVRDGAVMFMGRLVREPNDILVFGQAKAMGHEPGHDDATAADIVRRPWKEKWPHYVRVHHAEFVAGPLANGVSLNELMDSLKSDAFVPTKRNAARRGGNTDPRRAYMRQPAVELSPEAAVWLIERLERAFVFHGRLAPAALAGLDWPEVSGERGRSAG